MHTKCKMSVTWSSPSPSPQCQDHQEHGLHQPGADGGAVEAEVREGEGEEQDHEGDSPEAGG